MARRRQVETRTGEDHDEVIRWYRRELAKPAVSPWSGCEWEPVRIGPTWQTDRHGKWVLPEATLGWDALGWCGTELQLAKGTPWRFTLEQARWLLWWYAVDESGTFLYRDAVLQRLKGWGKDPLGACLLYLEALGPCRFAGWDRDQPIATDWPNAWVQTAAVAKEQTKNTMLLMPGLITPEAKAYYRVQIGKETIWALDDERFIQAVTSSPRTLQGARSSVLLNETHEWNSSNGGHAMAAVIDDNATKSARGAARTVRITNAYDPSEDSVAQRDREAWEEATDGGSLTTGILYDSLEAAPEAPLSAEAAPDVVRGIRGDSAWLEERRIVQRILDTRNPPSRARRYWYNQVTASEDSWVAPQDFDARARPDIKVADGAEVVLFFDGSKSDDATGLVGCELESGHVITLGMWQRPPGERGKGWTAPRAVIDQAVVDAFDRYSVVAFFADPSHTLDDETEERYWDGLIDEWHRRWRDRLRVWAKPGRGGHSVMWDMTNPRHVEEFTAAAMRCATDIGPDAAEPLTHDGDPRLRRHVHNARRYPNRYGVSIWKGHRESARKIDLAVCMIGARMVRRTVLNAAPAETKKRSGRVW